MDSKGCGDNYSYRCSGRSYPNLLMVLPRKLATKLSWFDYRVSGLNVAGTSKQVLYAAVSQRHIPKKTEKLN